MEKESIEEFIARGGKITHCKSGKAAGSDLGFKWKYSVSNKGRKKNTLKDNNFYL